MKFLHAPLVGWTLALAALLLPSALPAIDTGNHIDFAIVINAQADNRDSYENGSGFWIGYRRDLLPGFSIGVLVGDHEFHICRCDIGQPADRVTTVPVLVSARLETTFAEWVTVFGQAAIGGSFNLIDGDVADQYDLKIDPALAGDLMAGALINLLNNFAVGGQVDFYISDTHLEPNALSGSGYINLGHYGAGIVFVLSF